MDIAVAAQTDKDRAVELVTQLVAGIHLADLPFEFQASGALVSFANAVGLEDEIYEGVKAGLAYAG